MSLVTNAQWEIMSLDQRREREKQDRRDSILDAAELVFFAKGFEKSSMDEIARTAQLSRALLYVYFKDKAAIMRGLMLRAGRALRDRFEAAVEQSDLGAEQIGHIGRAYYLFSVEEPDYFDVLTKASTFEHLAEEDEQSKALQACGVEAMNIMIGALNKGVADGSLSRERVADPLMTAYFLRGALHGVIMQSSKSAEMEPNRPELETQVNYTLQMLNQSMRP
ncbi:TetR/AcrR family transcriptional regulator [uncultured Halopseudomonas sp.]|uniref:TetR/AcrR family transcriptional regulator n=1 Tax=uncultured Halopseudomonas sp. TaxID=2901193 RepID=UPI0030EDC783|tara:strand:+ start:5697 stop:6362 length:666 start_codon:yes stop_codon:yes gene_type:complete